jgi:hypothetical protein
MKSKLVITALVIGAMAGTTFAADAKSHKQHKASSMTTGSGKGAMSPAGNGGSANASGQGNVGPGTNNNNGPASGGK